MYCDNSNWQLEKEKLNSITQILIQTFRCKLFHLVELFWIWTIYWRRSVCITHTTRTVTHKQARARTHTHTDTHRHTHTHRHRHTHTQTHTHTHIYIYIYIYLQSKCQWLNEEEKYKLISWMVIIIRDQGTLKETVTFFWGVIPCNSVDKDQHFERTPKIEAAGSPRRCFLSASLHDFTS